MDPEAHEPITAGTMSKSTQRASTAKKSTSLPPMPMVTVVSETETALRLRWVHPVAVRLLYSDWRMIQSRMPGMV